MHFLSFSHLKVESLWQALGMTVPGLERGRMTYWKCSAGLPPSEPREVKLSCASDPQKAEWLSLDL